MEDPTKRSLASHAEQRSYGGSTVTYDEVPLHVDDDSVATQLVEGSKFAPHCHNILIVDNVEAVGHTPLELLGKCMVP